MDQIIVTEKEKGLIELISDLQEIIGHCYKFFTMIKIQNFRDLLLSPEEEESIDFKTITEESITKSRLSGYRKTTQEIYLEILKILKTKNEKTALEIAKKKMEVLLSKDTKKFSKLLKKIPYEYTEKCELAHIRFFQNEFKNEFNEILGDIYFKLGVTGNSLWSYEKIDKDTNNEKRVFEKIKRVRKRIEEDKKNIKQATKLKSSKTKIEVNNRQPHKICCIQ